MRYTFTQDLEVTNPAALYEAAKARWLEDQHKVFGISPSDPPLAEEIELERVLGSPEDPDIPACIEMMMDPGESPPGTGLGRPSVTHRPDSEDPPGSFVPCRP